MPKFKPGASGNPRGRPPGKGTPAKLRQILERESEALLKKAIKDALAGDGPLLRVLLDKAVPAVKARGEPLRLARFGADPEKQAARVMEMLAAGELNTDEADGVMAVIARYQAVIDLRALEERIKKLEEPKT